MTSAGLTAQAVADLVGGRLLGDGGVMLRRVGPLERADADTLSLAVSARYLDALRGSAAGAVLVPEALAAAPGGPRTRIVVEAPQEALTAAIEAMYERAPSSAAAVDPTARFGRGVVFGEGAIIGAHTMLGAGVRLGARCRIGAGVTLGDGVVVGDDSIIDPRVVCYSGTRIGRRVALKAGAVIGGDGFGYTSGRGGHTRLPHVGGCVIEDDVEIGANSCVDRGSIDDTIIGCGTKLDNLVHVGHNVRIGQHCLLMGGVGIGGSTRIGNGVVLAGHVCVVDHVTIGDGVRVGAKSLVVGTHRPGNDISGSPARRHRETLRAAAALRRLPAIVAELETMVAERSDRARVPGA